MAISAMIIAAASVGTAVYQGVSSSQTAKKAEKASAEQSRRQNEQLSALEKQQQLDVTGEQQRKVRDEARQRQQQLSAGATGRRSTILTSPLGLPGSEATGQKKTLLGE